MKKLTSKLGLFALAGALAFGSTSCKKELITSDTKTNTSTSTNANTNTSNSWSSNNAVYDRTVDYSVVVTAQADGSFRSPQGVTGATVTLAMGGEVKTATTDANGVAAFSGLVSGIAAVSVSASGHGSAHFTADLEDNVNGHDSHTKRTASTIVTMIPTSGLGTATVIGILEVENLINGGANSFKPKEKTAPITSSMNAKITGTVDFSSGSMGSVNTNGYLVHSGVGSAGKMYVEGIKASTSDVITTTVGSSSSDADEDHTYSFTVPATAYGLTVKLTPSDFIGVLSQKENDVSTTGTLTDDRTVVTDYNHTYTIPNTAAVGDPATNVWSATTYPGKVYTWDLIYK